MEMILYWERTIILQVSRRIYAKTNSFMSMWWL